MVLCVHEHFSLFPGAADLWTNSWVTEASETASGWCMGISNACKYEPSAARARCMYSIYTTAEGALAKHLRGATFCYTYSCSLPCYRNRHRNNHNNKDCVVNWLAALWPCCSWRGRSLVTASCISVISYREGSTSNTAGRLGSVHLAASLNSSLHSGLFSTAARRLDRDVDFPCAVLHAQHWRTIFEIREWAVC